MTASSSRWLQQLMMRPHGLLQRHWRPAITAGILLLLSNGPVLRLAQLGADNRGIGSDRLFSVFIATASVVSAVLAWQVWLSGRQRQQVQPRALSLWALAAAACYSAAAVLSSLWSVDPAATLWRSVVYVGLAFGAVALAGYSGRELADTLALFGVVAVLSSLALIALRPDAGIDHNGDWIGVYANRNSLAPIAAIAAIAGLRWVVETGIAAASSGMGRHACGAVLCAASLLTMAGAGSRTAWLALLAGLGAATVIAGAASAAGRRARLGWVAAGLGGIALSVAAVAALWNTPTLVQRRAIWSLVWERVQERPWGGHGFFVFWEVPEMTSESDLLQRGSAHNSLVETALGLGLLGTAPLVALAVLASVNAARCLWRHPSASSWMWAAVTVAVLVENAAESFVLWFSYNWVLLVAAALRVPCGPQPAARSPPRT